MSLKKGLIWKGAEVAASILPLFILYLFPELEDHEYLRREEGAGERAVFLLFDYGLIFYTVSSSFLFPFSCGGVTQWGETREKRLSPGRGEMQFLLLPGFFVYKLLVHPCRSDGGSGVASNKPPFPFTLMQSDAKVRQRSKEFLAAALCHWLPGHHPEAAETRANHWLPGDQTANFFICPQRVRSKKKGHTHTFP